jgi:hypothetical protein
MKAATAVHTRNLYITSWRIIRTYPSATRRGARRVLALGPVASRHPALAQPCMCMPHQPPARRAVGTGVAVLSQLGLGTDVMAAPLSQPAPDTDVVALVPPPALSTGGLAPLLVSLAVTQALVAAASPPTVWIVVTQSREEKCTECTACTKRRVQEPATIHIMSR